MVKVRINDKVLLNGETLRVKELMTFNKCDIAILERADKTLLKCFVADLTVIPEEDQTEDTITISREEFHQAVASVLDPKEFESDKLSSTSVTMITLTGIMLFTKLENELFNND